jgi:RNA recognition motif-containing protein
VNTVTIVTDLNTGKSKGYGFITMTDQAGAERAIAAIDGAEIDERKLSVRIADDKNPVRIDPVKKPFQKPYIPPPDWKVRRQEVIKKKRPRRP